MRRTNPFEPLASIEPLHLFCKVSKDTPPFDLALRPYLFSFSCWRAAAELESIRL